MKYYNLLFKGVEVNRKPLQLTDAEFEDFNKRNFGTQFELKLHPNLTEIEWFCNLSTEQAVSMCEEYNINPSKVSIGNMILLYNMRK